MSVQWRHELHVRIAVGVMDQEERVNRECRDAEEHLQQLLSSLERDAKLFAELSGRMDRQKNTAPVDWSGAYDKVMVDAGKSAEAIDFTPYRAVLDVEALHALQTEIAAARARLFALREHQSKLDVIPAPVAGTPAPPR